ncbi:MAG TPA: hypothetical protein PK765_06705 [bacterium]|nr:hypothetical protein [bacterium]
MSEVDPEKGESFMGMGTYGSQESAVSAERHNHVVSTICPGPDDQTGCEIA